MSLLDSVLILVIAYYIVQFITRFLVPAIFGDNSKDRQKKYTRERQEQRQKASRREGDVTISYHADKAGKNSYRGGEYIDYEEVKD